MGGFLRQGTCCMEAFKLFSLFLVLWYFFSFSRLVVMAGSRGSHIIVSD